MVNVLNVDNLGVDRINREGKDHGFLYTSVVKPKII